MTKSQLGDNSYIEQYTVYDRFGQVRFVLQPEGVRLLSANNWVVNDAVKAMRFAYRYDEEGRVIAKQIPGMDGEIRMVYDGLDRLVLSQDPKQATTNEWSFSKYDELSRPVITGICTITGQTHENLQATLQDLIEHEVFAGTDYGHTAYPTAADAGISAIDLHSVTYYDDYSALTNSDYNFTPVTVNFNNGTADPMRVKGQITATKVKVLDNSNTWLWTVSHYDHKGRVIQTIGDNHLGGKDVISMQFDDFSSRVEKTHLQHSANGQTMTILKWFDYDFAGRVLKSYYQLNNQAPELLAELSYNELGEVVTKRLGDNLQKVDYAYNIRGWLTKINGLDLDNATANDPKDLWGMELSYNEGFDKQLYNGNISGAKWTSISDGRVHAYGYQYDRLGRITQADYRYQDDTQQWSNSEMDFTVFGISYDQNGNILTLNRQGGTALNADGNWTFGAMDRLSYHYEGNRLVAVDDKAFSQGQAGDFKDENSLFCTTASHEYQYNEKGSLISDANKGISSIDYNFMELPKEVQTAEGRIVYTYDAAGIKLKKEVYDQADVLKETIDYLGEFHYKNSQIEFIAHEEGRLLPKGNGEFKPEYHYKDHLGNLRLSFREESAEYLVSMENANASEEESNFDNVSETRLIGVPTHSGDAVSQLNGANANRTMGPATVLAVQKGDKISFSAYARYTSGNFTPINGFTLPAVGASGNYGLEGQSIFGNGSGIVFNPLNSLNQNNVPSAYAVIHLLDNEGNVLETKERFISQGANVYHHISTEVEVVDRKAKFAVLYVANESPTDVYFDDLAIKHDRLVWQENSYYPFGLGIKPLDKEGSPNHRFTYNGKELEETTGYLEYGQRDYDSQLGRFHKVDRFAEKYYDLTSYHYGANNPIKYIDVNGDSLTLHFQNAQALLSFVWNANKAMDGEFKVNLKKLEGSKTGFLVGLEASKGEGKGKKENLSEGAQAFYTGLKEVIDSPLRNVHIDVFYGNKEFGTGDYGSNALDMADVEQWPMFNHEQEVQDGPTRAGKLLHEIREQYAKSIDRVPKGSERKIAENHGIGMRFENSVNKNTRVLGVPMGGNRGLIQQYIHPNGSIIKYLVQGSAYSAKRRIISVTQYHGDRGLKEKK